MKTVEYMTWERIKQRCYNPKHSQYRNYGGRGITVCKRWVRSFKSFLNDLGTRPTPEHSIERIKNHRGYSPRNCKWATRLEQANNKRTSLFIRHNGKLLTAAQWSRQTGIKADTICWRLKSGKNNQQALSKTHFNIRGENNFRHVLTEKDVLKIRAAKPYRGLIKSLAVKYGVCPETISCVLKRKRWKHV